MARYMRTPDGYTVKITMITEGRIDGELATRPFTRTHTPLDITTLAKILTIARTSSGLTQEQVADYAGVSLQYVCELESGKRRNPKLLDVQSVAGALGLSLIDVFERISVYETSNDLVK